MIRTVSVLVTSVGLLLAGCTGDEFLIGGQGGDASGPASSGSGPSTTSQGGAGSTSSASTTSTGSGTCDGCMQGGACQPGDTLTACGLGGETCASCTTTNPCQTSSCAGQACVFVPAAEGAACPFLEGNPSSGACIAGTCQAATEDCLNGIDDRDEDALVDCNDDSCDVSFTCVDTTREGGWVGPVALYLADVPCPATWASEVPGDFAIGAVADAYACTCECSVVGCDEVTFDYGTAPVDPSTCASATTTERAVETGACDALGPTTNTTVARNADLTPTCGAATEEGFELPPAAFDQRVTVCTSDLMPGGGCDGGACRPRAPVVGTEQGLVCIYHEGDVDCPEGGAFPTRVETIATELVDTRGCDCACTESSCGASVRFFDDSDCTECGENAGPCATLDDDDDCVSEIPAAAAMFAEWSADPSCATAGTPTGLVTTAGLLTFCCLPAD